MGATIAGRLAWSIHSGTRTPKVHRREGCIVAETQKDASELCVTRRTLYRRVDAKGELRPDGVKLGC